jgi:hypothetical protein
VYEHVGPRLQPPSRSMPLPHQSRIRDIWMNFLSENLTTDGCQQDGGFATRSTGCVFVTGIVAA